MDTWKSIRLELARTADFPGGSVSRAYLMRLPLDDDGMVNRAAFQRHPHRATVRRYWSSEPDESGEVIQIGDQWSLECNGKNRILELAGRPVRLGDKVSIVEADGTVLPFKVASIR